MSLIRINYNLLSNYISQIYLIIISIIVLPIYINKLGSEAYGLIAFFGMLQGLFVLLDLGLSQTLSHQTANYNAGAITSLDYRKINRSLSLVFYFLGFLGVIFLLISHDFLIKKWLKINDLNLVEVSFSMYVMIFCIYFKWVSSIYRGILVGFEKIIWLSYANSCFATFRFLGVLFYMHFNGYTLTNFFSFQLMVSFVEYLTFFLKANNCLPKNLSEKIGFSLKPLKNVMNLSLMLAFSSLIWVLLTQLDKLVLSGIIPLNDYGYFSLATLVAGGIIQISAPISAVIMPRRANLFAKGEVVEMKAVYQSMTEFFMVFVFTAAIVLASVSNPFLFLWSGDQSLANKASIILSLYVVGNAFFILNMFPFYIQYALGNLKYHAIGSILQLIFLIPSIIFVSKNYGAIGAACTWLVVQILVFLLWVPWVHKKIYSDINKPWFRTIFKILPSALFVMLVCRNIDFSDDRLVVFFQIFSISLITLLISILTSKRIGARIGFFLRK